MSAKYHRRYAGNIEVLKGLVARPISIKIPNTTNIIDPTIITSLYR